MDNLFYRKDRKGFTPGELLKKLLRNKRALLKFGIATALALFLLFGNHGVVQRFRLQSQKADMEQKLAVAAADSIRLRAESKALDGDAKAIEKVAREKYGMIREGETVYKVRRKD